MKNRTRIVLGSALAAGILSGTWAGSVPSAAADAPALTCVQDWRPTAVPPPTPAPSPVHQPFQLFCAGRLVATVWLSPFVNLVEAARLTADIVNQIPFPETRLAVNPARGITGLASWFWATPEASSVRLVHGNGPNMEFEVRVDRVQWTFGEVGSPTNTATGFGSAYPAPSAVQHVYERKGAYTVRGDVTLSSQYWIDQSPMPGPNATRTVTLRHPVAEIRNLLHAR